MATNEAQLALPALIIPEEFGGRGYGYVELIVVSRKWVGHYYVFFQAWSLPPTLIHAGDEEAKAELLPQIASGTITTLALTEENGKWDESGITMQASGSGKDFTLDGTKMYVIDGNSAEILIVAAQTDNGVSLFQVDANAEGLTRTSLATMDQTRKQSRIDFEGTPAKLIGNEGSGWETLLPCLILLLWL